jgi:hypothetical protein
MPQRKILDLSYNIHDISISSLGSNLLTVLKFQKFATSTWAIQLDVTVSFRDLPFMFRVVCGSRTFTEQGATMSLLLHSGQRRYHVSAQESRV